MKGLKIFGAIVVLAAAGVACGGSDNGGAVNTPSASASACAASPSTETPVKVDANASLKFVPANITVKPCQLVIWTVVGAVPHTVTSQSGATFDSGNLNEGGTFTQSFATAGTIHYFCKIHGASVMSGTITVSS
ncbi:MAG: hypothetical protein E6G46_09045 [Actinobacteria bacterium]|nr:MAG: hypothetical protein E6G46_09045 [Actinomycetota bacterium]